MLPALNFKIGISREPPELKHLSRARKSRLLPGISFGLINSGKAKTKWFHLLFYSCYLFNGFSFAVSEILYTIALADAPFGTWFSHSLTGLPMPFG